MSRRRVREVAVSAAVLIASVATVAAEEGGHAEHHAPHVSDLLFPVINFSIFLFIVVRYVVPAAREYLRRRHHDIAKAADDAAAALSSAERALMEVRARLAAVADESETITRDLVTIATAQAARARAQAEEAGQRRVHDAELLAQQERRRALAEVREETAARASAVAESRIRAALSADDQDEFVRRFLEDAPER